MSQKGNVMTNTKQKKKKLKVKVRKPPRNSKGQLTSGWGKGSHKKSEKVKPVPLMSEAAKASRTSKVSKSSKVHTERAKNGRLLPGSNLNPAGRGHSEQRRTALLLAIREVEVVVGKPWLADLIKRSYSDSQLAVAILGRLFPQLKAVEMTSSVDDSMADEEAAEMREEMKRRFQPESEQVRSLKLEIKKLKHS